MPEKYKKQVNIIKTYERIGTYTDTAENKIDILIVYLQKDNSIERARTTLRNFVADYLKSRGEKEAGLVAFVSPNQEDWRFSFIKMEYKITETPSGRIKAREEFTPARRYSFLVGKNENSHTAQSRLVPILQDDERNPTLKELEDVFSIEKVTKEFFEKYRELFIGLEETLDEIVKSNKKVQQDFKTIGVNAVDFTKKLLGQIVFLYFLQKKGWFGVGRDEDWGTGPKNFLRLLFEKRISEYNNFFNDILEPLFYEALAIERTNDFYSRFNCKIPFLNGGLFDPINNYDWVHTDILLPNELFSNNIKTKEGDIGTGILDVFDRYNFTVKEDEPLEKEVAVDPEMLGKVFENLLEVKDRKSKGTYYTPREIVHYMCQESLINYLATELAEKVNKEDIETLIKYGETVVEHEARVINEGRETDTYSFKLPESVRSHASLIDEKLETIRVCDPAVGSGAFLVGMMNEVVRTRNALTSHINDKKNRTIYDFKRDAIQNCLYGADIDPGAVEIAKLRLWLSLVVDEEDIGQIKPLPNLDYKIVCGNSLLGVERNLFNQQYFANLEELKPLFFNETNTRKKQQYKNQIDELISQITNGHKDFDFEVYFSEVFHEKKGFDVVIANPPYGETIKTNKIYFKENYICTEGKFEIYKFFIEKGLRLICPGGILCYITPDTWLGLGYFKKIRELILSNYYLFKITESLYEIFEAATVDNIVFWVINRRQTKEDKSIILDSSFRESRLIELTLGEDWQINLDAKPPLIKKLDGNRSLGTFCEVWQGLIAYHSKDQPRVYSSNKNESKFHRKLLYGSDIGRYYIKWRGEYLKYGDWLHRPRPSYIFDDPKILIQRIRNPRLKQRIVATYDNQGYVNGTGLSNILLNKEAGSLSLKYILGILNSKLINYWFSYYFKDVNIKPDQLRKVPIKKVDTKSQDSLIIEFVDKILAITKDDDYLQNPAKQAKVREYEKQIDQLVYKLYGLTPEEVKIIDEFSKNK